MKQTKFYYLLLLFPLFFIECSKYIDKNNSNFSNDDNNIINKFIYDGLSKFYLWNEELSEKVDFSKSPKDYFKSLLYKDDKWSGIFDDINKKKDSKKGIKESIGFSISPFKKNDTVYVAIQYVFANSPAADADLKRGDIIYKIDGEYINKDNVKKLKENQGTPFSVEIFRKDGNNEVKRLKKDGITPRLINTNPVLVNKILEIDGKKIGYLFYTNFIKDYNKELFQVFSEFKSKGVTDVVLDLRYNRGGAGKSAIYLSSMIAPESIVKSKEIFSILKYNENFKFKSNKNSRYGDYDSSKEQDPLLANLNLNKVYIIATGESFSASELTIHCLRPYLNVVHIGSPTGGKYTASWTIHPFDKTKTPNVVYENNELSSKEKQVLAKWGMQPIVAKYANKNGESFEKNEDHNLKPDYTVKEYSTDYKELGSEEDPFLKQAIFLITGDNKYKNNSNISRSNEEKITNIKVEHDDTDLIIN